MSDLIAKSIVNDSYYIVIDGDHKVGNVLVKDNGVFLTVNKKTTQYTSTSELAKQAHVKFSYSSSNSKKPNLISYPTSSNVTFNHLYDSKLKVQLFTDKEDSKSYRAAGYFAIKMVDDFEVVFCPKYIYLSRYEFHGPFHSSTVAENYVKNPN